MPPPTEAAPGKVADRCAGAGERPDDALLVPRPRLAEHLDRRGPLGERLVANGVGLASLIPDIDASVELVRSDALPAVRIAYGVAIAASIALPIVCLVLFAVGVLVARRRSRTAGSIPPPARSTRAR